MINSYGVDIKTVCPSCGGFHYINGQCEDCTYNWHTGRQQTTPSDANTIQLKRIADALENIESHLAVLKQAVDNVQMMK